MKFKWDRKYLYWGVTAFCVIALSLVFFWTVTQWGTARRIVNTIIDILNPIIIGLVIAYILTPVMTFFEKKFFSKLAKKLFPCNSRNVQIFTRIAGIITVILLLIVTISVLLIIALPQIYYSIQKLVLNMQNYYDTAANWLEDIFRTDVLEETIFAGVLSGAVDYFANWVKTGLLPQLENIIANISTGVISAIMIVFDFIIGVMVSCYILYRKEGLTARIKKLTYSLISEEQRTRSFLKAVEHIHKTFGRFFVGKLIDSLIIGLICAVFMFTARMPYPTLISVIIGITNIIPFFGPYIGAVPSAFLILLESPLQCVIFVAFIIILQTFDGNVLGPRIIGSSTGLSGFWVVFSILLFGGLFGIVGMLCGVPLFAVIYSGLSSWSAKRLKKMSLPTDTAAYEKPGPIAGNEPGDDTGETDT